MPWGTVGHMLAQVLTVTADDTTGALETAAACADARWRAVVVAPGGRVRSDAAATAEASPTVRVHDLRSRHLPGDEAASRVRAIVQSEPTFTAHKIDSTLRGRWALELEAVAHAGRPVLLVPAFPAAGRTCVDGTVLVDGVPVHRTAFGTDPRSPVVSSRPADVLHGAVSARDAGAVRAAFAEGARIVVADASTDADVTAAVRAAAGHPAVVVAGPAAVVATRVRLAVPGPDDAAIDTWPANGNSGIEEPVLVVSASRHPAALAQCEAAAARGVLVVQPPAGARVEDADLVLAELAARVVDHLATDGRLTTVVVVGGDTAAAVIGDQPVTVTGTLGVGVADGRVVLAGRPVRLVTKPGGFGADDAIVALLDGALPR